MKTKTAQPYHVYFRWLANGKISFGEYLRGKWFNVCDPFKESDLLAIERLRVQTKAYTEKTKREVEFIGYRGAERPNWL